MRLFFYLYAIYTMIMNRQLRSFLSFIGFMVISLAAGAQTNEIHNEAHKQAVEIHNKAHEHAVETHKQAVETHKQIAEDQRRVVD